MLKGIIVLLLSLFSISQSYSQEKSDVIIGVWESEDKDAKMEIYKDGNTFKANLLWGAQIVNEDGSSKKDVNNPDESLRNKDLVDGLMIIGLEYDGEEWDDGKVYNNANGKWYNCYVWMEKGQLNLRGYLGLKIMGQTTVWNRIK
jgi:uncharacterized protein (DUF2147 family)